MAAAISMSRIFKKGLKKQVQRWKLAANPTTKMKHINSEFENTNPYSYA